MNLKGPIVEKLTLIDSLFMGPGVKGVEIVIDLVRYPLFHSKLLLTFISLETLEPSS